MNELKPVDRSGRGRASGLGVYYKITKNEREVGELSYKNHYDQWTIFDVAGRIVRTKFKKLDQAKAWIEANELPSPEQVHLELCQLVQLRRQQEAENTSASEMETILRAVAEGADMQDEAKRLIDSIDAYVQADRLNDNRSKFQYPIRKDRKA